MNSQRAGTFRCSFSLPQQLAIDVSFVAKRLGISQSSLLAELLTEPIRQVRQLAAQLPEDKAAVPVDVVRRLRGQSVVLIREAVHEALEAVKVLGE